MSPPRLTYVTGGARSGKSAFAQSLAEQHTGRLLYVATAEVRDDEMAARVRRHREAREERWEVLEEPLELAARLPGAAHGKGGVLVDCLTLWLSNLLLHHEGVPGPATAEAERLLACLLRTEVPLYVVSGELGMGIVPENRLARTFRDLAGEVNQRFAAAAGQAWLVASGLPLRLK